jgi:hypothetical protein
MAHSPFTPLPMGKTLRPYLRLGLALLIALLTLAIGVKAEVPFYWDSINVNLELQQNSDLWITETQTYVFTGHHTSERYRYIPLDKVDRITDVTVAEQGKSLVPSTGIDNNQFWIRWEHSLNAPESHTFVLKYRVLGGVQVHGETAEVYWKAIFPDRQAIVKAATVTVRLPQALAGKISTYTAYGIPSSDRAIDDRTIEFVANQALPPGQALEVRVSFPNSVLQFARPGWQRPNLVRFIGQNFWILPVSVAGVAMVGGVLLAKRCPQCGKFTLDRHRSTLQTPSLLRQGRQQVVEHCRSCFYHREFEQVIFYSDSSGSGSGGGGGGG